MFSKTQNFIGGLALVLIGAGLFAAGLAIKNAAMTGFGSTLAGLGLGWLGLSSPRDIGPDPPVTNSPST